MGKGLGYSVTGLCRLFGVSKQAYYKYKGDYLSKLVDQRFIREYVLSIRDDSPGIGGEKLWHMYKNYFGSVHSVGRDCFMRILRKENLLLRKPRRSTRTTDSRHNLPVYPNLVKDLLLSHSNQVWVSDITYIRLNSGSFCFLSLITDAYTHEIIGHHVGESLEAVHSIEALKFACKRLGKERPARLIHHSDRGVQYACMSYIEILKDKGIQISMTENGNPKENAIAERINGILKGEFLNHYRFNNIGDVRNKVNRAVEFYNTKRPHRSIDMNTPVEAGNMTGNIPKRWISYKDKYRKVCHEQESG